MGSNSPEAEEVRKCHTDYFI